MNGIDKIRHKLNLYRRYRYWSKSGCIYIHIPKAAGTSISRAIYGRPLGHYRAEEIKNRFPRLYDNCFTFTFVRNPWDRAYSAYKFAKIGRTESMGMANHERYQIPEFESFERFILEWLAEKDVYKEDFVFQPQYRYVLDENKKVMVDFLGKVETMGQGMASVEEKLSKKLILKHINRTAETLCFQKAYSKPEMVDVVSRLYAEDIELFDYKF